ncbi:LLM class flavin-dependent oxidoreductase [Streptomyces sp. NPDC088789]|uniref:LLM class flavin-dependent oxidoreductase n=1 Tax=Streptomyces sp. NPDC088789 TaxID=3365899 RepID=UPI00381700E7
MTTDPQDLVPFARLVDDGHAQRLWQGQSLSLETHQLFAYLAGTGLRVPVGTSVVLMPMRHPLEAAVQARSLARLTGHGMVLGLGPSTPDFVKALHGRAYSSPRDACVDYLGQVRRLLHPEDGVAVGRGPDEVALAGIPHPGVELGLGVLRPVLAHAAGRVADVAISWMTPPGYVRGVLLPALAKGASEVCRPVPRLVTVVHAALARPGRNPYRLAYTGAGEHLRTPHYTDMLRRAGLRVHPAQSNLGARALVDSGTFLYGTPTEVAHALVEYDRAGVDEVVLNPAGVGVEHGYAAAVEDLREILSAFHRD